MQTITYTKGDATAPKSKGVKIVAHICNDLGGWGKGFVLAISKRWDEPEKAYRKWHRERAKNDFGLGSIQTVKVNENLYVVNMIAQRGMKMGSSGPPIRYDALKDCLKELQIVAIALNATVNMPRIGCGLAGGKWPKIEPLVQTHLVDLGVKVMVYDF